VLFYFSQSGDDFELAITHKSDKHIFIMKSYSHLRHG